MAKYSAEHKFWPRSYPDQFNVRLLSQGSRVVSLVFAHGVVLSTGTSPDLFPRELIRRKIE